MAQTQKAIFDRGYQDLIDYTPSGAVAAGDIVFFGSGADCLVAVANAPIAANTAGAVDISGRYKIKKKAAETFAIGDLVGWDVGVGEALAYNDGTVDKQLGVCVKAAVSADDFVIVKINFSKGWEQGSV